MSLDILIKPHASLVYCLLVNRVQFLREQSFQAHHQTVNMTRALLCEIVASKILRRFDEDNSGYQGLLLLANVLVAGFEPFQNAPLEVIQENSHALHWAIRRGGYERKLTALEVAIISHSKTFLATSACQKITDAIYRGRVVYTPSSFMDILPDPYKRKPISLYDPKKAPLLNQYRLIVPRTRNVLEIMQFVILLVLYMLVMQNRHPSHFTIYEVVFCIYTCGWVLDQLASMLEHGWQVYTQNLWSFLDVTFSLIFALYLSLRLHSLRSSTPSFASDQALDVLAVGAPILVPRLAFNLMSENMLFVSLRAMMADFTVLTLLAVWSFGGFLLALYWLGYGTQQPITISKWMLWVWFGLDGTGIGRSTEFHYLLGPILMVTFAFLGNTLFLTILVSMLSNTFANIVSNATAEIQFRRAVLTFEGVKSDAIFAYQPPFNILALLIMLPLKFILTPRWFHKVNVAAVRTLNAPLLLIIALIERGSLWPIEKTPSRANKHRRRLFWDFSRFSVHGDIEAVFEDEPPQSVLDEIGEGGDDVDFDLLHSGFQAATQRKSSNNGVLPGSQDRDRDRDRSKSRERSPGSDPAAQKDGSNNNLQSPQPRGSDVDQAGKANAANRLRVPGLLQRQPSGRKPRKESIEPTALIAEHLPIMLRHYEISKHKEGRIDVLEERSKRLEEQSCRMEGMLKRLCESLDLDENENGNGNEGRTGDDDDNDEEEKAKKMKVKDGDENV